MRNVQRPEEPEWPYAEWADYYLAHGWNPLPLYGKRLLVEDYSGHNGAETDAKVVARWAHDFGGSNIALRVPDSVIGIDVDAYDGKSGESTLAYAAEQWGPLPATWTSTSRSDGVSGIRLYRVEPGRNFKDRIEFKERGCGDVQIVQRHHRYVTVAGSIHSKTGALYRWIGPDGQDSTAAPAPGAVAELPSAWADALSREPRQGVGVASAGESDQFLAGLAGGEPDALVVRILGQAVSALAGGSGSRHDSTRDDVARLLRASEQGALGVRDALTTLRALFVATVGRDRPEAEAEFDSMVTGGAALIAGDPSGDFSKRPSVRIICASDVPEKELEWLWPGHLAYGHLAEIIGDSNTGKSLIAETDFAARVSRGLPFPGEPKSASRAPGNVLVTATEDGFQDVAKPRLIAAGADLDRVFLFELEPNKDGEPVALTLPDKAAELRAAVEASKAEYLVISPISAYLSESIRSQVDASVRRALSPVVRIAADNRLAVFLVRHPNKNRDMQAVDRGSGSGAFTQLVRSSFGVGRHPDDPDSFVFSRIANNLAAPGNNPSLSYRIVPSDVRPDQPVIEWGEEVFLTADDVMSRVDGRKYAPARTAAEAVLRELEIESGGRMPKAEAYEQVENRADVRKDTIRAACERLGIQSVPIRTADGKKIDHWELQWPVSRITLRSGAADDDE